MFCSKCGSEIQNGAKFCGNCGTVVAVEHTQTKVENAVEISQNLEKKTVQRVKYIKIIVGILLLAMMGALAQKDFNEGFYEELTLKQEIGAFDSEDFTEVFVRGGMVLSGVYLVIENIYEMTKKKNTGWKKFGIFVGVLFACAVIGNVVFRKI